MAYGSNKTPREPLYTTLDNNSLAEALDVEGLPDTARDTLMTV